MCPNVSRSLSTIISQNGHFSPLPIANIPVISIFITPYIIEG